MKLVSSYRFFSSISEVRVRFAPSPTGFLHLGGLRTAFVNFLYARKCAGKFILRIEDTDQDRIVPGALEAINKELKWAGLHPDESPLTGGPRGPYIQSERVELYQKKARKLLESGHAYRCFCSTIRLDLLRKEAAKNREKQRYDNRCRKLSSQEIEQKLKANEPFTLRLKLTDGPISHEDMVQGKITIDLSRVEGDPIILKSDGFPTYHFANVVDDHLMAISHVFRGNEWLGSTPKHIMLYNAFGWDPPSYGHLPLIIKTDGSKLSKRSDDVRLENMREKGFHPEVLISALYSITMRTSSQAPIWTLDEMSKSFSIESINKHSNRLDPELLKQLNSSYIHHCLMNNEPKVIHSVRTLLEAMYGNDFVENISNERMLQITKWASERISFLPELVSEFDYIWVKPEFNWSPDKLNKSLGPLSNILRWSSQICKNSEMKEVMSRFKDYCERDNIDYKKFMRLLRYALTNRKDGPPIGELLEILGQEKFCEYLDSCAEYVENYEKKKEFITK